MRKGAAALIVEDEESVQRLLQAIVRRHCDSVDVAGDGQTAIDIVQQQEYDVVVLDLMLPRVNGFQVLTAIQELPRRPKVIVLSAIARHFQDRFPEETVVLQKPFDLARLDEILLTLD
jgi:CheY-like chemotaxis protein